MIVPGANLFYLATKVIGTKPIGYVAHGTRTQNAVGQWVSTQQSAVVINASVQAVDRAKYIQWGLDFNRVYSKVFIPAAVVDVERDITGDQFLFDGYLWQIDGQTDWFARDGWIQALVVRQSVATMPSGVS